MTTDLLTPTVRSRDIVDTAADETPPSNSYIEVSGMFLPTSVICPATPSIFERNSMTLYREPTLYELLNDPVIHLVMKADGVIKSEILELYARAYDTDADTLPAFVCSGLLDIYSQAKA